MSLCHLRPWNTHHCSLKLVECNYKGSSWNIKQDYRSNREKDCHVDAGAGVTSGEQRGGNCEEESFSELGFSLAGKEAATSGRDGDLCCVPGREREQHHRPPASMLKMVYWDVAFWVCCFFLNICRCLSHYAYVHQVVLKPVIVPELNPTEPQNWWVLKGVLLLKIVRHFLIMQCHKKEAGKINRANY